MLHKKAFKNCTTNPQQQVENLQ